MAGMVCSGIYESCWARESWWWGPKRGMPLYKYIANRSLRLPELLLGTKLSEFHTGYRAFSRRVLESCRSSPTRTTTSSTTRSWWRPSRRVQHRRGFLPDKYFPEASSISFRRSVVYGLGVLGASLQFRLWKLG